MSGVYSYQLPNGTMIYTDEEGSVLRIAEGGVDFMVSDFNFTLNESGAVTQISLAQGVRVDVERGLLSIEAGFNFKALLSAIKGSWSMNHLGTAPTSSPSCTAIAGNDGSIRRWSRR